MTRLENSQHIRRARNATGHITRLAANEEGPTALLPTMVSELLELEELADGAPPAGEQHLVQQPVVTRRPGLEGRLVARHGGEVVPDPAQHVLGALDAGEVVRDDGSVSR